MLAHWLSEDGATPGSCDKGHLLPYRCAASCRDGLVPSCLLCTTDLVGGFPPSSNLLLQRGRVGNGVGAGVNGGVLRMELENYLDFKFREHLIQISQFGPRKWGPKKLSGLPKIGELIPGDLSRTQPPDSWSVAASPAPATFCPRMDVPLSRPSLLQVVDVFNSPNWQESQRAWPSYLMGGHRLLGWSCTQLWRRSLFAGFRWEASSSVLHLLMSVLGPLHTELYQHTYIMHHAWHVTWCVEKNQGLGKLSKELQSPWVPRQWPVTFN